MRGSNFTYLVKQGITSVWHNRMMSFASFCILMVSLFLVGTTCLLMLDINMIIGNVEDKNQIVVVLEKDLTQDEINHVNEIIISNQNVASSVFYSKEQAWEDKKAEMQQYAVLFDSVSENPMYDMLKVTLSDLTKIDSTVTQFETISGVNKVNAPYDFASFLVSLRTTLTIISGAILVALVVVCLVIVYNTTRTSVFSRRKEINIMKFVGATNAFIKIPFFIEGMFIGVIGGLVSWLLTKFAYEAVVQFFSGDVTIWQVLGMNNIIQFDEVQFYVLGLNLLAGIFLGALGTVFSMGKHLKV